MLIINTPMLIPIIVAARGVQFASRPRYRKYTTWLHEVGVVAFMVYLLLLISITVNCYRVFHGYFDLGRNYNTIPMAGIKSLLSEGSRGLIFLNIAGNILLFAPFGFLLPLLWERWSAVNTVLFCTCTSFGIEILQFFTGRVMDIDDVILNSIGAAFGVLAYSLFRLCMRKAAASFRLRKMVEPAPHDPDAAPARQKRTNRARILQLTGLLVCVVLSSWVMLRGVPFVAAAYPMSRESFAPEFGALPPRSGVESLPLHSSNAILLSVDGNEILLKKNAAQRIYPASMTKIMTVLVALEQLADTAERIELSDELFTDLYSANAAIAGFIPGERVPVADLLYGAMLPSGAECSVALATHVGGSQDGFVVLMNQKAEALGMHDTHFANATGLHDDRHYSTVQDIAILTRYAIDNERFAALFSATQYSSQRTNLHPDGITFYSTLFDRAETTSFPGGEIIGGKTGYTHEAGQCLASVAQVDDRRYILVTAGATPKNWRSDLDHIDDALAVYSTIHRNQPV